MWCNVSIEGMDSHFPPQPQEAEMEEAHTDLVGAVLFILFINDRSGVNNEAVKLFRLVNTQADYKGFYQDIAKCDESTSK